MATTIPPTYYFNGITYNSSFFNSNTSEGGGVTQSYADSAYLARTGYTTSRATNTSFLGSVNITGSLTSLDPGTLVTTSNTSNTIATTGTTNSQIYSIPFVPLNLTSSSQTLYVDNGAGVNHLNYTPSTNTLSVGSTNNGNLNVIGTASQITVAGNGTALTLTNGSLSMAGTSSTLTCSGVSTAISVPTGSVTCNGTGVCIAVPNGAISLGKAPLLSYTTLPTYLPSQIGYALSIQATLPASLTNYASGTFVQQSAGFTLTAGSYILTINNNYTINSPTAGYLSYIISGISTSPTSFAGGNYVYTCGYQNIGASVSGQSLIFSTSMIIGVSTSTTYYLCSAPTYTGTTLALATSLNYATIARIG